MANSQILAIGSVAKHRGVYDASTTYYYQNQCTMYGSLFEALSDNFSGVAPMEVASDGSVSLANTSIWKCIVNNVDLYNKVLSTNALDTRVSTLETNIKDLETLKEKMGLVVQDSKGDTIDNYSEVLAFLNGYKDSDTLKNLMDGVNGSLQSHNAELIQLELKHLNPRVVFGDDVSVVEYVDGKTSAVSLAFTVITDEGNINKNSDFNNLKLNHTSDSGTLSANGWVDNSIGLTISYSAPVTDVVKASGTCKYKGVDVAIAEVTKIVYCVKASYIGYTASSSKIDLTDKSVLKEVKKNLAGSYSVTNASDDAAYLFIAVPKNGNVDAVNKIAQRSSISVDLPFSISEDDNYTYYVCNTGHNKGTYTFEIS